MKRLTFFIIVVFLFVSCRAAPYTSNISSELSFGHTIDPVRSRVLLYIHSTSNSPTDIEFTISKMLFKSSEGQWVTALGTPASSISSINLVDNQVLLNEAFLDPGTYVGVKLFISGASVRHSVQRTNLSLPEPGGEIFLDLDVTVSPGESVVTSFEWNPDESIEKRYIFNPALKVTPQVPAPKDILLFVSNSGSNYISVIDRTNDRVIAAVTVGQNPTGMAFDTRQDTLYVVNSGSRTLSAVDVAHFEVVDTIDIVGGSQRTLFLSLTAKVQ